MLILWCSCVRVCVCFAASQGPFWSQPPNLFHLGALTSGWVGLDDWRAYLSVPKCSFSKPKLSLALELLMRYSVLDRWLPIGLFTFWCVFSILTIGRHCRFAANGGSPVAQLDLLSVHQGPRGLPGPTGSFLEGFLGINVTDQ